MALGRSGYESWAARRARQDLDEAMTPTEAFREALSIDLSEYESARVPFYDWAIKVPEPKAGRLDFDSFPFQLELYQEAAADTEAVVKKATQVGVSAYLVRWTMYWADTKGLVALYVFPTRDHVYDFSDSRMKPAIEGSEYLRSRISPGDVQNKGLKKIGLGFVYFRGSETKRGLDSVDADVLALDEYDTLTQANIGDAERRISGSRTGLVRRVGVPSIDDFGISREYAKSDKRRWFTKCEGCGLLQTPRFKENVAVREAGGITGKVAKGTPAYEAPHDDLTSYYLACEKCRKPLDVLKGEWVAEAPERPVRGYHMPRLIVGHTNLNKIVEASKDREPYKRQVHHNKDLAEAFEIEGSRLTRQEIKAAQRSDIRMIETGVHTDNLVTAGIDVASARNLHVRISEHISDTTKKALWIGEVTDFDALDPLMDRFGINMACIDHMPEQRLARAFAQRFPGRVYLVRYAPPEADKVFDVDDEMGVAKIKRVAALDTVIEQVRGQRNLLPNQLPHDYPDQMVAVVRKIERDEFDRVKVTYISTDADDYIHAEAYDVCARETMLVRQVMAEATSGAEIPFEEVYEFERSGLGNPDSDFDYSEGPSEGEYGMP